MGKRQERREKARIKYNEGINSETTQLIHSTFWGAKKETETSPNSSSAFVNYYNRTYKKWLILPIIILVLALLQIGYQTITTGSFVHKGVELKGGVSITLTEVDYSSADLQNLQTKLKEAFPNNDLVINMEKGTGVPILVVKADITEEKQITQFKELLGQILKLPQRTIEQNLEITGSTIGNNFFRQTLIALVVAFFFMAFVVIVYLRKLAPALAVILCAFADMVETLALVNILEIKLSTAGIVAFLFLIGYSVDTDMLLSIRVLRRKEGTHMERVYGAMKTGLTMTATTLVAVLVALMFTQSEVIQQIMVILLIGLIFDMFNTWIQNVAILLIYLEKKEKEHGTH